MFIIDRKLKEREAQNNPIRVGVIGAGEMGKGLINQVNRHTPGMKVVAVYNRTITKAKNALNVSGAGIHEIIEVNGDSEMDMVIEQGNIAITSVIEVLLESKHIDVLVELTGNIKFALEHILKAFEKGKHVVSFNAELEATFGPLIKSRAEENKVLYTLGDGDQPGVTQNLYRHVEMMGFQPLLCGNVKGLQDNYRTPDTQKSFAAKWDMSPQMATNFADGTKISFEQAVTANANGMSVAKRGMIGPKYSGHIDDLTSGFYPDVEKLKEAGGIVDYVLGGQPGPGVFILATTEDPLAIKYLEYGKQGKGPLYSFYVPYHLLFFELAFSIARLIDFEDVTVSAQYGMKVEVITTAKEDLQPGDLLDTFGGFKTYGLCENVKTARADELLPIGLAEGSIVRKPLKKDEIITINDVEIKEEKLLNQYLKQIAN